MNKLQHLAEFPSYIHPSPEAQALHDQLNEKITALAERFDTIERAGAALAAVDVMTADLQEHAVAVAKFHRDRLEILRDQIAVAGELDNWTDVWDRDCRRQLADAHREIAEARAKVEQLIVAAGWPASAETVGPRVGMFNTHPTVIAARNRAENLATMMQTRYLQLDAIAIVDDLKTDLDLTWKASIGAGSNAPQPRPPARPAARHKGRLLDASPEPAGAQVNAVPT